MTTTTVQVHHVTGPTDLYCQYSGQYQRQAAFVALSLETGSLWADYDGEIGNAVPFDVWHRRVLRWYIPALRAEAANALLDEIAPLAQRVLDGASIEWNGHNMVGRLTTDADAAAIEIDHACSGGWSGDWSDEYVINVVDALDWFEFDDEAAAIARGAATADAAVDALLERLAEDGTCDHPVVEGVLGWVRYIRDH